jgi:hypothetical protein
MYGCVLAAQASWQDAALLRCIATMLAGARSAPCIALTHVGPTAPYKCPPPGLERLQFSECFGHQAAEKATELDNDARFAVHQLKQELTNELGETFPELLQAEDLGDIGQLVIDRVMSACPGAVRNSLLDVAVLTLAENNRCSKRADFEAALNGMLGEKLDAVWRSRFYGSVYHVLRVRGIPCFPRRRSRHGSKRQPQLDIIGPMVPAASPTGAMSADGLGMEAVEVAVPTLETKNAEPHTHAHLDSDGESTPTSSTRNKSPVPLQASRIR